MPKLPAPPPPLHEAILRTLHYFHYFNHGLQLEEVHKFLGLKCSKSDVEAGLMALREQGFICHKDSFFGLSQSAVDQRVTHLKRNVKLQKIAQKMGRFISKFPFVRGVYLSGSLSKGGATGVDDDIDYFIITAPGRVWTAKMFLILFKKVFLLNNKKYFCINLLMSSDQLSLDRRNIYIATEAASILPLAKDNLKQDFFAQNSWLLDFFPNLSIPQPSQAHSSNNLMERIINGLLGEKLERWAKSKFERHVAQHKADSGYYEVTKNTSAFFPESMEDKVLEHYNSFKA